ncbi:MAG TPA: NAD-dependent epimerase/dehydratase family protein [Candidatus Sulfotelmatobacter sp.]
MNILISGVCGFVGSHLARYLIESHEGISIVGLDNLTRPGSETNRVSLKQLGVRLFHGDTRMASDLETLPVTDWVIDAAAQPSVLAGRDGKTSSRQLIEHNLLGTINILEYCRASRAGLILLSTSRVYSIPALAQLLLRVEASAFTLYGAQPWPADVSLDGVSEGFSTEAPISLYGATKLASELLAQEYASAFGMPTWINRCGVLAGAGQFGTAEQGIFSYWLHAHSSRRPLKYLGFGGHGFQVRDALHPRDLARMVDFQLRSNGPGQLLNISGGRANSMSLRQLTDWCDQRFGPNEPVADGSERPYDIPWLILDSSKASAATSWKPEITLTQILDEIAEHAAEHPDWLMRCGV